MKKKGFTLIELIVCIGLLAIIGVTVGINMKYNTSKTKEADISDSIETYYYLNNEKKDYKYYYQNSVNKVSCLQIKTLSDQGLLTESELKKYKETDIVKIVQDADGHVVSYNVIDTTTDHSCDYYVANMTGQVGNKDISNTGNANNGSYSFNQTVTQNVSDKNLFDSEMTFSATLITKISKPVYITIVLDRSGSMENKKSAVIEAIKNMLQKFISADKSSYNIGLIAFGTYAYSYNYTTASQSFIQNNMGSSIWLNYANTNLDNVYNSLNGLNFNEGTYYKKAFDMMKNYLDSLKTITGESFKYDIFLSDGIDIDYGSVHTAYGECLEKYDSLVTIKDTTKNPHLDKLFTIYYNSSSNCLNEVATQNCGTKGNEPCYSSSDPTSINNLFSSISDTIIAETGPSKVTVDVELNDYFVLNKDSLSKTLTTKDDNNNIKNFTIDYTFDKNKTSDTLATNYSLTFLANEYMKKHQNTSDADNVYLIKKITVTPYYNKSGKEEAGEKVVLDLSIEADKAKMPYITINTSKETAIN